MNREDVKCRKCGCRRFWRIEEIERMVDFGQEGAIEGAPFLEGSPHRERPIKFQCAECGNWPGADTAIEMEKIVK